MNLPSIRPYHPEDIEPCLGLFRSNLPRYFAPHEEAQFETFLRNLTMDDMYYVIVHDDNIAACGGLALSDAGQAATFTWGMVSQDLHGAGLGKILASHRIAVARSIPTVTAIHLDTSQFTKGFYARLGFELLSVQPDGYGAGFDKCAMVLKID